ncbi:hypothetical protein ACFL35_19600 [Candidatus Riflebacteria bacterium]
METTCFNCKKEIESSAYVCPFCQSKQRKSCGRCKREIGDSGFFCETCREKAKSKVTKTGVKKKSGSGASVYSTDFDKVEHQFFRTDREMVYADDDTVPSNFVFRGNFTNNPEHQSLLGEILGGFIFYLFWLCIFLSLYNLPAILNQVTKF